MPGRVSGGSQETSAAASSALTRAVVPNPRAAAHQSVRRLLLCFFLSGAAALIYQLAWTKSLALLFGYSAYALGTVLAVFMGGLALGSAWLGKRADSAGDAVRLYAWIELAIAGSGALSVAGLALVRAVYLQTCSVAAGWHFGLLFLRFVGAAVVLLLPTVLMGASFPVLIRGATRTAGGLGVALGRFYAVNTAGAVVGTLAAGFVLLPLIGLRLTVGAAVVLNLAAGLLAFGSSRESEAGADSAALLTRDSRALAKGECLEAGDLSSAALLVCFAAVGATAIALEMSWTRLLATWLGSSTYSFTVVLATFLAGIAIGSYLFERRMASNSKITLATFAQTQFATAAAALLFLLYFREMPALVVSILSDHQSFVGLVLAQFFASAFTMLPTAIAFGFNFPLVTLLVARADAGKRPEQIASSTGRAYAANTSGAVVAAIVTGFWLLPHIGSFRVVAGTAAVSILLALFLAMHSSLRRVPASALTAAALAAIAYCIWSPYFYGRALASFGAVLYGNYHGSRLTVEELADMEDLVFLEDGMSATIAVARSDDYVALKTNGKVDASTVDTSTQLLLGDLGAIFHPHPRRVLIIGFGGGMTASAVARFPDVERIDCVEIEPAVLRAANYLRRLHRGVLSDPRLHVIVDDARNFIQTTREPYDLIISEPSNPWIAGVSSLYTDEFYGAVRKRLAPGGMFVQWVQAYGLEPADFRMILATLAPNFPDVSLWRSADRDFLVLARTDTSPLTFDRARSLWSDIGLKQDFQSLRLTRPESWPAYFRLSDAVVRAFAADSPINTDDRTSLEYRAPRSLLNETLTEGLDALVEQSEAEMLPRELDAKETAAALVASAETAVELGSSVAPHYPFSNVAPKSEQLLLLGRMALQSGHVNDALELLDEANRESDNHSRGIYWLAVAEHRNGSMIQADATRRLFEDESVGPGRATLGSSVGARGWRLDHRGCPSTKNRGRIGRRGGLLHSGRFVFTGGEAAGCRATTAKGFRDRAVQLSLSSRLGRVATRDGRFGWRRSESAVRHKVLSGG